MGKVKKKVKKVTKKVTKKRKSISKVQKKKILLEELSKSFGNVTLACKKANIGRTSFYLYYNQDEKFATAVDEVSEKTIDFVESMLYELILDGDRQAILFFLKTKGKNRGYVERHEQEVKQEVKNIEFIFNKDEDEKNKD